MNLNKIFTLAIASVALLGAIDAGFTLAQDPDEQPLTAQDNPKISPNQALKTVLSANQGAQAFAVEMVKEKGTLRYDVELNNGKIVVVDANTGKVITTEQANK